MYISKVWATPLKPLVDSIDFAPSGLWLNTLGSFRRRLGTISQDTLKEKKKAYFIILYYFNIIFLQGGGIHIRFSISPQVLVHFHPS